MIFRPRLAYSLSLSLVGVFLSGCEDPANALTPGTDNGNTNCPSHCNTSPAGNGTQDSTSSAVGAHGNTNATTGTSSTSAGSSGATSNGTASTSGASGSQACTDAPRPSESCANAVSWGFCNQSWFSGHCEASCGHCTPSGSGSTSSTGSGSTSNGSTAGTDSGSSASRVDNPYVGVTGYVNPEWRARAESEPGGKRISNSPVGVWMDRIAAIDGSGSSASMGLRDHLDEALAQKAGYIQIVIYNLPGRDCAALSSNGELGPTEIDRYKTEYIDAIAAIESDAKYSALRIINIVEIDSLPNLVTNTGSSKTATAACDVMKANGNYQKGIQYALGTLYKAGNTYNYIDAGHHGWIGWDENFNDSASLFAEVAKGAEGGFKTVTGFITNTANYSALEEPFIKATDDTRQSKWLDWNRFVDEKSFATAFRTKLVSLGFDTNIGMLIDTSRNGWGGPDRPTAASTATDVDTRIDESRVDRRFQSGNWCNQSGAGLGERPRAVGAGGIDAYVWIKPPGESDGASQMIANDQGKGVDGMCDPTYTGNARNNHNMSGALGNAPLSGAWFSAQFQELMANAYPPL